MATPPRILAWRIPWTEEPGELQSQTWLKRLGAHAVLSWRLFSVPKSHSGCGVTFPQLRLLYVGTAFWSFLVFDAPDGLRITGQTCCWLSLSLDLSDLFPTVKLWLWLWGLKILEVRALIIMWRAVTSGQVLSAWLTSGMLTLIAWLACALQVCPR